MIFARRKTTAPAGDDGGQRHTQGIRVTDEESGQKLMGLLEQRLLLPPTLLHRWIRTGQIRLNGARVQPFVRVAAGDAIRVPPFAGALADQARATKARQESRKLGKERGPSVPAPARRPVQQDLIVLGEDEDFLVLFKPSGLPTQPGTGHSDAVTVRLKDMARGPFVPRPVHRLDKDTSGLLLAARNYTALKLAHDALRGHVGLHKEYLVWVHGVWPHEKDRVLRHYMHKGFVGAQEKMIVQDVPGGSNAREAVLVARPLKYARDATLLQILLITGRTHQIRAQLAHVGFPVVGDGKYGRKDGEQLCLHSLRLTLPDGKSYQALPRWQGRWSVESLPAPLEPAHIVLRERSAS